MKSTLVLEDKIIAEKTPREKALEKIARQPEVEEFLKEADIALNPENIKQREKREMIQDLKKVKKEQDKPKKEWPRF